MSGDQQLRAFIERILRLKEEQDTLADDIREVYAEAKGSGYDKTALGEVVAYLRKIEKKGRDAVSERTALFDLYLDAYERPSHAHTREGQSYAEEKGRGVDAAFVNSILVGGEITDNQASETDTPRNEPDAVRLPPALAERASDESLGAHSPSAASPATIKPAPTYEDLEIPAFLDRRGELTKTSEVSA